MIRKSFEYLLTIYENMAKLTCYDQNMRFGQTELKKKIKEKDKKKLK